MKFENVYFINGTAYAGKSTMVKALAKKYGGIACEENYHNALIEDLNSTDFPNLTYTRDLVNWSEFIRRTPDEYEAWKKGVCRYEYPNRSIVEHFGYGPCFDYVGRSRYIS